MSLSATTNVTRQLPLTLTAQVPARAPLSSCSPRPGRFMSPRPVATFSPTQDEAQAVGVFRLDSGLGARGEEAFQAFVSKSLDRHCKQCNVYGYRWQSA